MALKATCPTLAKVAADEPIFVLRAKDKLAPRVVEYWTELAAAMGCKLEKVAEARRCVEAMAAWQDANGSKCPD